MRRRRAAIALAVAGVLAGATGCSSSAGSTPTVPPSFTPKPGTFRLAAQVPGNGAPPQPQLLTAGTTKVLVGFGGAFEYDHHAVAGMSLQLAPAGTRAAGRYPAGAVIALGAVRVQVLAVYDRAGESHDLVDLRITSR